MHRQLNLEAQERVDTLLRQISELAEKHGQLFEIADQLQHRVNCYETASTLAALSDVQLVDLKQRLLRQGQNIEIEQGKREMMKRVEEE